MSTYLLYSYSDNCLLSNINRPSVTPLHKQQFSHRIQFVQSIQFSHAIQLSQSLQILHFSQLTQLLDSLHSDDDIIL